MANYYDGALAQEERNGRIGRVWDNPLRQKTRERGQNTPFMSKEVLRSAGLQAMLRGTNKKRKAISIEAKRSEMSEDEKIAY